ncbi:MAG: VOC family protein [Natronohydrobacter sp.]|nr:VOC family protein [Natronohydrobacter sp.]
MITGVNHVTLVVSDLARSLAFWRDTLGLTLRAQSPRMAYLEGGKLWLCLERGTPSPREDDSHIALSCTPEDYATLCARLATAPVWKANHSEGASLYILDPDGHKLELHLGDLASRLAHYRKTQPQDLTLF